MSGHRCSVCEDPLEAPLEGEVREDICCHCHASRENARIKAEHAEMLFALKAAVLGLKYAHEMAWSIGGERAAEGDELEAEEWDESASVLGEYLKAAKSVSERIGGSP